MVAASNLLSPELLVHYRLRGGKAGGHQLILSAGVIWMTNVAVFALWYRQLDRGGPDRRARRDEDPPDFLFVHRADGRAGDDARLDALVPRLPVQITIGLVAARAANILA